ncbi:hypothetical protein A4A49_01703 [Nicotiana attenuata]|uniref:Uncharacterized protein n=1 Tax=Nicotiana attenuata TaxID=49451 RepID=A0A1J6IXD3_NICAT|nr:hypothetical protein A4A49_01703 [Nicotiana attenuata]
MGYLWYVLGIQIIYTMYISTSPSTAMESNDSSMALSGQDDHIVFCVRDCMRICMKLDGATSGECEHACRNGCRPLLARKEIGTVKNFNSSDLTLPG